MTQFLLVLLRTSRAFCGKKIIPYLFGELYFLNWYQAAKPGNVLNIQSYNQKPAATISKSNRIGL